MSLSKDFAIERAALHDVPIGARHVLHNQGERIIRLLGQGTRLADVYATASQYRISKQDIHELLGLLNLLGALHCTRSTRQHMRAWIIQSRHLLIGIRYTPVTWRSTANAVSLLMAIMRATAAVTITGLLVCTLIIASGLLPAPPTIGITCLALGLFIASLFVHETTHLIGIRVFHATPVLLQRGMRLGIIHPPLSPKAEIRIALAGPAWGMGICLLVAGACLSVSLPIAAIACGIVGSFHVSSLLPWYSDGATLQKALRGS